MRFHLNEVIHVPGKEMYVADALSRIQITSSECETTIKEQEMNIYLDSVLDSLPVSDIKLLQIKEAHDQDPICKEIKDYCLGGWPDKFHLHDARKPCWSDRGELNVVQGVLLKSSIIAIPSSLRLEVLDKLHEGHKGITKRRERAKSSVWWPGLSRQIQDVVENCKICAKHRVIRPEPLMPTPFPERPWQMNVTDLFELDHITYLIVVDYFSRYAEVVAMNKTTKSSEVIRALKTTKSLLKKEKDPTKGLLTYRSTPLACGHSPAELLMGRKIKTTVPTFHTNLASIWPDVDKLRQKEEVSKDKLWINFNQRHRPVPLEPLQPGTQVYINDGKHRRNSYGNSCQCSRNTKILHG